MGNIETLFHCRSIYLLRSLPCVKRRFYHLSSTQALWEQVRCRAGAPSRQRLGHTRRPGRHSRPRPKPARQKMGASPGSREGVARARKAGTRRRSLLALGIWPHAFRTVPPTFGKGRDRGLQQAGPLSPRAVPDHVPVPPDGGAFVLLKGLLDRSISNLSLVFFGASTKQG